MIVKMNGVTRIVIILNDVVIKIPKFTHQWSHFLRGILANITENRTWKWNSGKFEKGTSHLLCPVIWCSWGGWVIVMKKAAVMTYEEWEKSEWYNDQHRKHFPGDDTVSNYGILNNTLVKIDYGQLDIVYEGDRNSTTGSNKDQN